jgi:sulfatase maturation enzyme AslB (radical SAM superfamily)
MLPFCSKPWATFMISPFAAGPECTLAEIFVTSDSLSDKTFSEIWNSGPMQALRLDLLSVDGAKKHGCNVCRQVDGNGEIYEHVDRELPDQVIANLELNRKEFSDGRVKLSSLPLFVSMDLWYKCNFSCLMCELINVSSEMSSERIGELLETLPNSLVHLHVSGGEPLLHTQFRSYLSSSQHLPATLSITTNGHFLDNSILKNLLRFPRVNLHISIDSFVPEVMAAQRVGCDPERVFEAVQQALACRDHVNRHRHKSWYVCLQLVPTRINVAGLPTFLRFSNELGVDEVQFCCLRGVFPDLAITGLPVDDASLLAKEIRKVIQSGIDYEITGLDDLLSQLDSCANRQEAYDVKISEDRCP